MHPTSSSFINMQHLVKGAPWRRQKNGLPPEWKGDWQEPPEPLWARGHLNCRGAAWRPVRWGAVPAAHASGASTPAASAHASSPSAQCCQKPQCSQKLRPCRSPRQAAHRKQLRGIGGGVKQGAKAECAVLAALENCTSSRGWWHGLFLTQRVHVQSRRCKPR